MLPFTYRFAARVPSDSKGSECQCGIHTAEAASALRSRKTQRAAKEVDANLTIFLAPTQRLGTPTRRHALGRLPTPPPLPENLLLRLHRKLPSAPPGGTSRSTRFTFTSTASPPAPLTLRMRPRASVESIEPRPPTPRE